MAILSGYSILKLTISPCTLYKTLTPILTAARDSPAELYTTTTGFAHSLTQLATLFVAMNFE